MHLIRFRSDTCLGVIDGFPIRFIASDAVILSCEESRNRLLQQKYRYVIRDIHSLQFFRINVRTVEILKIETIGKGYQRTGNGRGVRYLNLRRCYFAIEHKHSGDTERDT